MDIKKSGESKSGFVFRGCVIPNTYVPNVRSYLAFTVVANVS